jgi:hypothetical protein
VALVLACACFLRYTHFDYWKRGSFARRAAVALVLACACFLRYTHFDYWKPGSSAVVSFQNPNSSPPLCPASVAPPAASVGVSWVQTGPCGSPHLLPASLVQTALSKRGLGQALPARAGPATVRAGASLDLPTAACRSPALLPAPLRRWLPVGLLLRCRASGVVRPPHPGRRGQVYSTCPFAAAAAGDGNSGVHYAQAGHARRPRRRALASPAGALRRPP